MCCLSIRMFVAIYRLPLYLDIQYLFIHMNKVILCKFLREVVHILRVMLNFNIHNLH